METFIVDFSKIGGEPILSKEFMYCCKEDLVYDIMSDKTLRNLAPLSIRISLKRVFKNNNGIYTIIDRSFMTMNFTRENTTCEHTLSKHSRIFIRNLAGECLAHGIVKHKAGKLITILSKCESLKAELRLLPSGIYNIYYAKDVQDFSTYTNSNITIVDILGERIISSGKDNFAIKHYDPFITDFTSNILKND